jgi:hypothetical protein
LFPFFIWAQKVPVAQKQDTKPEYTIDLYSAYKNAKTYPLSTIAESVDYIPLETTPENLLESCYNICVTSDEIFVFDFSHKAYCFNKKGDFLNKIGRIGRGPGECQKPTEMVLDTIRQQIILLDHDKLVTYDYDGNFISRGKLQIKSMGMLKYGKDHLLIKDMYYSFAKPNKRYSMYFYSLDKKKEVSKIACEKKDKIPFCICEPIMYSYNSNTFVKDYWSDTIYRVINPFQLEAYAKIKTGKLKHRDNDDNSVFTGEKNPGDTWVVDIKRISESNRFIFLVTNKGQFIYDKKNDNTFCCSYQRGDKYASVFENDLTSRPNLFPFSNSQFVNDNLMVTYKYAYEFFEDGVDAGNPKIKKLMQNLQPEDNPVLVLVKLKDQ